MILISPPILLLARSPTLSPHPPRGGFPPAFSASCPPSCGGRGGDRGGGGRGQRRRRHGLGGRKVFFSFRQRPAAPCEVASAEEVKVAAGPAQARREEQRWSAERLSASFFLPLFSFFAKGESSCCVFLKGRAGIHDKEGGGLLSLFVAPSCAAVYL